MSGKKKPFETVQVSPEAMEQRIARFDALKPQSAYYDESRGIPGDAYEMLTANTLYTLMAPSEKSGPMSATPAIQADSNLSVIIAECPPNDKPMLHAHFLTTEHFFCLKGRFRIRWGDDGENETILEPFDMIAVPKAVCRDFTNITDETGYLLVMITGDSEGDYNDIGFAPGEAATFRKTFGKEVAKKVEEIGFYFLDRKQK